MKEHFLFIFHRLKEKLWFKPLIFCFISISGALIAQVADSTRLHEIVPDIKTESLSELLNIISASMLVVATFTVGSMLSAFSVASNTATPRSFKLITADDVSQNALSVFIGSFIFSIVALVALKNGYYGRAGLFTLFIFTLVFFSLVILTFLRWVERISKLGRMGHTIQLIEEATINALKKQLLSPTLNGIAINPNREKGKPLYSKKTGYVQGINIAVLQKIAQKSDAIITINAMPGKFASMDAPLVYLAITNKQSPEINIKAIEQAFTIGNTRYFDEDPRFGIITLSEIASRALSPAVNDPGTAIQIIGSHIRLFCSWNTDQKLTNSKKEFYDRIAVPEIVISDLFEDAFRPIARDGAANIEVMIRLQKSFQILSKSTNPHIQSSSLHHSYQAFERAKIALKLDADLLLLKENCLFLKKS